MAFLDTSINDITQLAGGDLTPVDNPVLESIKIRIHTARGSVLWDPAFGSRLHLLPRETIRGSLDRLVVDRVLEALQPMVIAKEISGLEVTASRVERNRIEMFVRCYDSGSRPLRFTTWVAV